MEAVLGEEVAGPSDIEGQRWPVQAQGYMGFKKGLKAKTFYFGILYYTCIVLLNP